MPDYYDWTGYRHKITNKREDDCDDSHDYPL